MLEGMYTAAAGMAAQQTHLDAVASDLANVEHDGLQARPRRVPRPALRDGRAAPSTARSQFGAGAAATTIGRSLQQGGLQDTGQPLDVALQGNGFIAVRGSDGQPAMTRDGALRLDDRNRLVTSGGLLLDPPVSVPAGTDPKDIEVGAHGDVSDRRPQGRRAAPGHGAGPQPAHRRPGQHLPRTARQRRHRRRPRRHHGQAGRPGGLQRRHGRGHDRHDRGPAGLRDGLARRSTFSDQMAEIANGVKR